MRFRLPSNPHARANIAKPESERRRLYDAHAKVHPGFTDYEKKTGWKYSITCTNIPAAGIGGVPGSHQPQYLDVLHTASTPWSKPVEPILPAR